MSRAQKYKESYEQFCGALSDLARSCEIGINPEQECLRDVFIFKTKNRDLQRRSYIQWMQFIRQLSTRRITITKLN